MSDAAAPAAFKESTMNARSYLILNCIVTIALLVAGCGEKKASGPTANPQGAAPKVDPAMAKLIAEYPLDTCVVGGEKLGSMGAPADIMHEGRLVRFCCSSCEDEFKKDPAKYLAKIDEAAKAKK
jgi:YHS domain-containing protein